MFHHQIKKINNDLKRTKRAIISFGCSFVEGQGAIDQDLYETSEWSMDHVGIPMTANLSKKERSQLLKTNPLLYTNLQGEIQWEKMEQKNAFVNVLCNKYYGNSWTPINFGIRGRGNRASIRNLYYWPELKLDRAKQIIVVWSPSGMERYDFVNDVFDEHNMFHTVWPHKNQDHLQGPRKQLWDAYADGVYTEKQAVLETIATALELKNWCKARGAKLIITPAFDEGYTKKNMIQRLNDICIRNGDNVLQRHFRSGENSMKEALLRKKQYYAGYSDTMTKIVEQWPWEDMFKPQDQLTFAQLCTKQEKEQVHFWEYSGKGSPNDWITVCAHPSAKGHDLFAEEIYKKIEGVYKNGNI